MNRFELIAVSLFCLFLSGASSAVTLRFDPASPSVLVGDTLDVGVVISDLGLGSAPSISTFDLDIKFDESQLSFASAAIGDPVLGDQLDIFGFGFNPIFAGSTGPGIVNLFELSLDLASDLDFFQADSFVLGTLTFDVLSAGTGVLDIAVNSLGDTDGNPLAANLESASIVSARPGGTVPESSTLALISLGLAGIGYSRQRQKRGVGLRKRRK